MMNEQELRTIWQETQRTAENAHNRAAALSAQLAEANATIAAVRAAWDGYDEADMGEVPWRLQRDMNAALGLPWSGR